MVSLAPETIFHLGSFPVTNTLLDTIFIDAVLVALVVTINKNLKVIPGIFQNLIELIIEMINDITKSVATDRTKMIFPYFMSFFLFIVISNWSGLLPILTSIGFFTKEGFIPLFRSPSTDLNTTLALAIVSIIATHSMSIRTIGIVHYLRRFFSINPFYLFIGLLELISEFTKVISFSFRLFGNVFVGEVMISQLSAITAFFLPLPLLLYELAVGLLQAVIFGMLTMAFMSILTTPHDADAH
ncbi:MAG TPA: FoF1 ATP synthase subunit a [Patescibacteria group bacterium]